MLIQQSLSFEVLIFRNAARKGGGAKRYCSGDAAIEVRVKFDHLVRDGDGGNYYTPTNYPVRTGNLYIHININININILIVILIY